MVTPPQGCLTYIPPMTGPWFFFRSGWWGMVCKSASEIRMLSFRFFIKFLSTKKNAFPKSERRSSQQYLLCLFCFQLISDEDTQIIPTAVKNTIHIHIVPMNTVERHIASGDQEAIVCIGICNG